MEVQTEFIRGLCGLGFFQQRLPGDEVGGGELLMRDRVNCLGVGHCLIQFTQLELTGGQQR